LAAQGDKKCDEAVGYVCTPDTNVCWETLDNVNGKPYGWSADVTAISPPPSGDITLRFA
jgi:hypothetical protein